MAMALGEKGARVVRLLIGMRNPRIASALMKYGFSDADLQEGWTLLLAVGRVTLDTHAPRADADTIRKLDEWEDCWFPIAAGTLAHRFPAVHAQVFKNLSPTDGPSVAVSVRTFIERLDQMAVGAGAYGADGPQAKAILEARGLTPSVLNEARALLETAANFANVVALMAAQESKTFEKAENELWEWYLEWSEIARVAIGQDLLLRQLGLLSTRSSTATDMDDLDTDVDPSTGEITSPDPFNPFL